MPPRPEGTDGRDHNYRMLIETRYKFLADSKTAIVRLLSASGLFVLLRTAWLSLVVLEGITIPSVAYTILGGYLLTVLLYLMAGLGKSKESLRLLKAYNVVQGCTAAVLAVSAWHYHTGVATGGKPTNLYPFVLRRLAEQGKIPLQPDTAYQAGLTLELFLDLTTGAFLILSTLMSHKLIVLKMEMKKEAEQGKMQQGAAKRDEGSASEGEKETKVVRAAASARSRKRMA